MKPCVFVGLLQIVGTLGVRLESSSWFISQFHASPPGLLGIRFQHGLPPGFVCLSLLVVGLEAQVLASHPVSVLRQFTERSAKQARVTT